MRGATRIWHSGMKPNGTPKMQHVVVVSGTVFFRVEGRKCWLFGPIGLLIRQSQLWNSHNVDMWLLRFQRSCNGSIPVNIQQLWRLPFSPPVQLDYDICRLCGTARIWVLFFDFSLFFSSFPGQALLDVGKQTVVSAGMVWAARSNAVSFGRTATALFRWKPAYF